MVVCRSVTSTLMSMPVCAGSGTEMKGARAASRVQAVPLKVIRSKAAAAADSSAAVKKNNGAAAGNDGAAAKKNGGTAAEKNNAAAEKSNEIAAGNSAATAGNGSAATEHSVATAGHYGAAAMEKGGARSVTACATHGVLSGPAIERIQASVIKEVVILDTIALPPEKHIDKITVLPVAPVFAQAIERIYADRPISPLFNN